MLAGTLPLSSDSAPAIVAHPPSTIAGAIRSWWLMARGRRVDADHRRAQALGLLIQGTSRKETSRITGVSVFTVSRWCAEPDFSAALAHANAETVEAARQFAQQTSRGAIVEVHRLAFDKRVAVAERLRALRTLLDYATPNDQPAVAVNVNAGAVAVQIARLAQQKRERVLRAGDEEDNDGS